MNDKKDTKEYNKSPQHIGLDRKYAPKHRFTRTSSRDQNAHFIGLFVLI